MRKYLFTCFFILISEIATSQVTYTFNGNGNWSDSANWLDRNVPPNILSAGSEIIINPIANGECILDVQQTISAGAILTITANSQFRVIGDFNIQQTSDSTFNDPRDNQVYIFRHIGTQVWMTRNLNYAAPGSWCYVDNSANCDIYGRLYNWDTAMTVAPPGWHLPSDTEWTTLINYLGGESVAGGAMKSATGWATPNAGATNSSGFGGLPSGLRKGNDTFFTFDGIGYAGYWWSSMKSNTNFASVRYVDYFNVSIGGTTNTLGDGISVRCIRD